jgi:hypothetical protein
MNPLKFFAGIGSREAHTTAPDARRTGPFSGLDFQKGSAHSNFKKAGKARRCCFTLVSRVRGQPDRRS